MTAFLSWYLASSLLGWLTFPLVYRLLPALADRGYTFARAAGILFWGWVFWLLGTLGILRNDLSGLLFAFLLIIGFSFWSLMTDHWSLITEIKDWLHTNTRLLLLTELLFLLAFAFMTLVRAANPDAVGTEKPMELAFINATLRSPTLPPNDPWMSGYSISYYHFGYILTAMFARLTAVPGSVAFNLMLALIFGLAAIGSYGVLYNLLCAYGSRQVDRYTGTQGNAEDATTDTSTLNSASSFISHPSSFVFLALLAPLFLLILSNFEGFLEVIHGLGWFWPSNVQPSTFNFWSWLNIKDLSDPPSGGAIPTHFWWWWRASRVVQDFDLLNAPQEVIDEFPFFSFLLGDLHPHVLALPFNMLGIGVALNIFLDGWRGVINIFDYRLRTTLRDFFFAALVLGGLAFLNTWDILPAAVIIVGAYVLARVRADGWSWSRLEDALLLGLPLGITAILLYLPFYVGFSSQAGGILPNLVNPTRGTQMWVMWGTLLLPLLAWLFWLTRTSEPRPRLGTALAWTLGLLLLLWAFSWLLGLLAQWQDSTFAASYISSQGQPDLASFFKAASLRRLSFIGGLLTIASITWLSLSHLLATGREPTATSEESTANSQQPTANSQPSSFILHPSSFVLLLTLLASLLIIAPDFVYLRDYFGYRINTIFKFYYQGWQLWSIAAAFGTAILLQKLRGFWSRLWRIALILILAAGLTYPALALPNKTDNFKLRFDLIFDSATPFELQGAFQQFKDQLSELTLDSAAHLDRENPDDAAAIRYLQTAPLGVVAEAVGGSYTGYARISTHSGDPAVIGWPWHEFQWRGNWDAHGTREIDMRALYENPDWESARLIIDRYHIRYIVVGMLERTTYNVSEAKFQQNLPILFQAGTLVIYGVP
jgi:YYY domain-containing protein